MVKSTKKKPKVPKQMNGLAFYRYAGIIDLPTPTRNEQRRRLKCMTKMANGQNLNAG